MLAPASAIVQYTPVFMIRILQYSSGSGRPLPGPNAYAAFCYSSHLQRVQEDVHSVPNIVDYES